MVVRPVTGLLATINAHMLTDRAMHPATPVMRCGIPDIAA